MPRELRNGDSSLMAAMVVVACKEYADAVIGPAMRGTLRAMTRYHGTGARWRCETVDFELGVSCDQ